MTTFNNPIVPGFYPDPSICEGEDGYYLVNSSFDYFPGIPLHYSKDLVNWEQIGYVLDREEQLPLERVRSFPISQGIYAPTIRYHDGIYYVISTNMTTMETFYTYTDDPRSKWSDIIKIDKFMGYDPSLFFDENGTVFLTAGAIPWPSTAVHGIIQAEIDLKTGTLLTEAKMIWQGTGHSSPEGPHLYKKDGWYYLMAAEGGTEFGHMETIARSLTPSGPFENNPGNPIVSNRSTSLPLQATGHADMLLTSKGEWIAVLHGIRPLADHKVHHLGRETLLVPVVWNEEGWPVLGNHGRVEVVHELLHEVVQNKREEWVDFFENDSLNMRWNNLRHLVKEYWYIDNGLVLQGNSANLSSIDATPVFVGCRQQDDSCEITVELEYSPNLEGEEAGLTIFMNEEFHYDVYLTMINNHQKLALRKQVGDICFIETMIPFQEPTITILIRSFNGKYEWFFKQDEKEILIGQGEARLLSKEVAGGFTGVFFGMYATGNSHDKSSLARFRKFSYQINNM